VPVVFLSSASDNMNIVMAMNMGGDDFIAKPFDLDVLTAKVRAQLRRAYDFAGQLEAIEHRGALLNLGDATLAYGGQKIELTKNEYRVLQTLMEHKGRVVSREALMMRLWETDDFVDENTLTVNVARLRRKLDAAGLPGFIATKKGLGYIVDGSNLDDTGDYRPGMKAARELLVTSPLKEAGLTKKDIRELSKQLGLPTWNKPSFACLSSRIPYGQEITKEKLNMIDAAEQYLLDSGFRQIRVRHHGDMARIEVSPEERAKFFNMDMMDNVSKRLKEIGFSYVTLDLQGYRTGSMNEVIKREE
jgi:DNA-binding winged helix-turn-helix (wHTH) protein